MTAEETSNALAVASNNLRKMLEIELDPDRRLQALWLCFGQYAEIYAVSFFRSLQATPCPKPHRGADDLEKHVHIVVDELVIMLLESSPAELLECPEFRSGTHTLVARIFMRRLTQLIAAQPAQGSA